MTAAQTIRSLALAAAAEYAKSRPDQPFTDPQICQIADKYTAYITAGTIPS
jgi:hypothetical protein